MECNVIKTPSCKENHPGEFEIFDGNFNQHYPTVWKAPLHYRNLKRLLIISLKGGKDKSKNVWISNPCVVKELEWWAYGGLRANRISL